MEKMNSHEILDSTVDHDSFERKYNQLNELLRYIVEHMRGSVAVHDRDLRYIYVSQKYLEEYELVGQDIIGKHHYEVFPDLPQKWRDVHKRCLMGEVLNADDDPFIRSNGDIEITRWECRPWFLADGSIGGIIVYTELITDQKAIEKELIASKERYMSVFNDAPIGIALIDTSTGRYLEVNPELCNITGRSEEEMLRMSWQDITNPDDISQDHLMMKQLLSGKVKNYSVRKRYFRPDGQTVWVRNTVTPYKHSETPCHLAMVIDISDMVKRQERVEFLSNHDSLTGLYNRICAEEQLQKMNNTDSMPFSLLMIDINGLKLINDAFGQNKGDEILVKTADLISDLDLPAASLAARLGGDEFALLLPNTSEEKADKIRLDLINKVSNCRIDDVVLSVSVGFATTNIALETLEPLYKIAEDKMNRYKLSEGSSMRSRTIDLIINSLHEKNSREMHHSKRVSEISVQIAEELDLAPETIRRIQIAGLMHDIGKIGIPDSVLNKPGKLTAEEWQEIKKHSEKGYKILSSANEFSEIADYVLQHHERWDGKGYPQGLAAAAIMLEARIISLADAYDAMTSDRTYRKALPEAVALAEIERCSGSQFDPAVADAFVRSCLRRNSTNEFTDGQETFCE